MIAAIIPVHDEAARVEHAVTSLHRQTRPPERILVMSDDSTDATVEVALDAGAEVLLTVDNRHDRAGALNQALDTVRMEPDDLVLVLDAGVRLPPGFLARALAALQDRNVGAVSARSTAVGGPAALIRWRALEDVRRSFGRYCDEGPVTGQMRLALDLEAVGWRLCPPLEAEEDAPVPVEHVTPAPVEHIAPAPVAVVAPVPVDALRAEPAAA
ncbi:glycosyltransferase family 2 protein [Kocuria arenosa]|jgi:glycosyltransferase involved in cell wall biosynthesis|uniref:glycosyltransferase n=1 Tax=Kocuria arenosa TaxID=3071446 RepID=UPI0034D6D7C6